MINGNVSVSSSGNGLDSIKEVLEKLKKMDVLVGIPEDGNERKDNDPIGNAQLLFLMTNGVRQKAMRMDMEGNVKAHGYHKAYDMYIHTNGSPLWGIPPRPIIEPAIEADKEIIADLLKEALKAGLAGNLEQAKVYLKKAGQEGQAASQSWFTDPRNGWAPNSPITVAKKDSDKPLIDTGQLSQGITWVPKGWDE